jgi:hypothetical protein
MRHLKVVGPPLSSSTQDDVSFKQWLAGLGKKVKASSGLTLGLTLFSAVAGPLHPMLAGLVPYYPQWILPATCILQFVVIFALILWLTFIRNRHFAITDECSDEIKAREAKVRSEYGYEDPNEWVKATNDAQTASSQYWNYWMALLVCLLMQYALMTFLYLPGRTYSTTTLMILATFINNCVALNFLFCYFTLDQLGSLSGRGKQNGKGRYWALGVAILILLTGIEGVCTELASNRVLPDDFTTEKVSKVFGYISGVITSVAMGFFLSRLASKFLACPTWVLILFTIYMAIQPLFAVFGVENQLGTVILTNIALLLKGLLCLYMMFLFEQGRLLFYFVRVRRLNELVSAQMKDFTSILET